jgi:hypothetical protein
MEIMVSVGEVLDKISILDIKKNKITDVNKLKNIIFEYSHLVEIIQNKYESILDTSEYEKLYDVNLKLWDVEDEIRIKELNKNFGQEFIELARSVYFLNDKRAEIKKDINLKHDSKIIEEKSYEKYQ